VKRQLFILFFGFLLYLLSGSLVLAQNFQFQTESNKVFQGKPEVDSLSKNNKLNQIIVTFKKKPTAGELIKLSRKSKKSRLKYAITGTDAMVFEVSEGVIQESLNELRADTIVESAVVDKALDLLYIPNDPAIKATPAPGKPILQWSLYNLNLVGSGRTAFDISKGSSGVTVAVLDSQVDSSHEDLQGKFSSLVDCTSGSCQTVSSMTANPSNLDESHGTHVAGIIGAATNNNLGIASTGFNTNMLYIRIRDQNGNMLISYFVNAVRYAADHNAKIINMSLGSLAANLDGPIIAQINDAVTYAWNKGVLLVAAAGNCGWNESHHKAAGDPCDIYDEAGNFVRHSVNEKYYPAASPNMLNVAALDVNNNLAPYSQHNDPTDPQIGNWISILAPGGNFSTNSDKEFGIASTWPLNSYYYNLGTSAAAPHVSGIAALIWAAKPVLTNLQVKSIIEQTANKNIASGTTNNGMVDAVKALDSLNVTITPVSPTPTGTPVLSSTPTLTGQGKPGDANGDNKVDGLDYVVWLQNYNKSVGNGRLSGDFSGNGFVDGLDYVIWLNNYNK